MAPQSPQRSSRLGAGVPLALALRFYRSWTSALMRLRAATSTSLLLTPRHEHLKRAGPPRPPRLRVRDRDPSKCTSVLSVDDHRRRGGRDVHTRGTVELGLPPEFFRRPPGCVPGRACGQRWAKIDGRRRCPRITIAHRSPSRGVRLLCVTATTVYRLRRSATFSISTLLPPRRRRVGLRYAGRP